MKPLTDNLLWLDLECTGSNVDDDEIIEIGCVLTTYDLEEIGRFSSLVKPGPKALGRLMQNDVVRTMHQKNGLLTDIQFLTDDSLRPHSVVQALFEAIPQLKETKAAMSGSGVRHYDKKFVDKYMPQLSQCLRYWVIDVGVIRRATSMWTGHEPYQDPNEIKTHRALDDALVHLNEGRYYRDLWSMSDGH